MAAMLYYTNKRKGTESVKMSLDKLQMGIFGFSCVFTRGHGSKRVVHLRVAWMCVCARKGLA